MDTTCEGQTAFRPGISFKRGKLYEFDRHGVTVMRGWPVPLAWRKTRTRPWRMIRPKIQLVPPADPWPNTSVLWRPQESIDDRETQALKEFCAAIPQETLQVLSGLHQRQWHMLSFLARCGPAAMELAQNNPALAFCLANNWVFHRPAVAKPLRAARAQLPRKQHQIAGWLGFPPTRSAVKILVKIAPDALAVDRLLYIRAVMTDPAMLKTLRHLPRISRHLMVILTNRRLLRHVSGRFLHEVAVLTEARPRGCHFPFPARPSTWLFDTLEMGEALLPDPENLRFDSLSELWTTNMAFFVQMDELEEEGYEDIRFPPPPIPGSDTVLPITTPEDLAEEGRSQNNCVRNYIRQVAAGSCFFYRILHPERATLCLRLTAGQWHIGEVKSKGNREVRTDTAMMVQQWFLPDNVQHSASRYSMYQRPMASNRAPNASPTLAVVSRFNTTG